MEFKENLTICYPSLTKQGRRLADFISDNPSETIKLTAKQLGIRSGTSAPTVVRLYQRLGYESYEQMKISIAKQNYSEELSSPIDTIISNGDSIQDISQKLLLNQITALRGTLELLDYDALGTVIELLQRAERVFLFGVGSSGIVVQELCHRLNRIGKSCLYLEDSHTNLEYSSIAGKNDLVICFSYSGETKEVYIAAENAKKRGAPVVAVTRNRVSSLSARAKVVITVPDSEKRLRVGAFSSITSQRLVSDILYMGLLQKDFNKYENMLIETSQIVNRLRE